MTDRELLELAAKAAGIPLRDLDDQWDNWEPEPVRIHRGWNPLTDDGDALRLAVKLCMSVTNTTIRIRILARPDPDFGDWISTTEPHNGDPLAATRKAIVRAAAEIGKGMK